MALLVKHNRAAHTHENEQFRKVASSLKILFKKQEWNGILIGNPYNDSYSRFRGDAILLYDHGLIIIDFKMYSGTLKLPANKNDFESTQWFIETNEDKSRIPVKAGNKFINPFKQLHSYREAFKEIVKNEIQLTGKIQESKTCALNIFSGPLEINNNIPKEIPFYKIVQEKDLATFLYDYSSDNCYSKETADALTRIFNAEDWHEHIELPKAKTLFDRTVKIDEDVESAISSFLKKDECGILVLTSMSAQDRDDWIVHIHSEANDFNIPQIETWIHSARIGRKVTQRTGIELQSLFNTIYGGAPKAYDFENSESEERQFEEQLKEVIPIRSDDSVDNSAVIILHEAHLVSRSLNQSELLRFGSGRLLEDLFKFLKLDNSKRKLICIGDPYSLTYGKDSECAINPSALAELYDGNISIYRHKLETNFNEGKVALRNILANGIEEKLFNNLDYPWKTDDLIEVTKDEVQQYLSEWFSNPIDSEPSNTVMVYSNKDAKKINNWIKTNCLKNGKELAKNDLLLVNNNVNIPDETGFGQPTKLYNGMFLLVEEVGKSVTKPIPLRQSAAPILLHFTQVKVKCLSLPNKMSAEVWLLNNYFNSEDKLSMEEQIAFRVYVNMLVSDKVKEQPFEDSYEQIQMSQDKEYKALIREESEIKVKLQSGEKVKTKLDQKQREIKKILNKYIKKFKNRLLANITQADPFVNAVHANFGWSLTVHKCIGVNFSSAIINAFQGENRGITNSDYYRWLYSAITTTSGLLRIVNPQRINPLMDIHFEDTVQVSGTPLKAENNTLSYQNYKFPSNYNSILSGISNENIIGSVCELAKIIEQQGYLLSQVFRNSDYLYKASFTTQADINRQLIIAIHNKGQKEKWVVSSIRIEKCAENETEYLNNSIAQLFKSTVDFSMPFPTDFRGAIYESWRHKLNENGYKLILLESHNNLDVFKIYNDEINAKFQVYYGTSEASKTKGFFTKFNVLNKSDESIGSNLKKWLIDGN